MQYVQRHDLKAVPGVSHPDMVQVYRERADEITRDTADLLARACHRRSKAYGRIGHARERSFLEAAARTRPDPTASEAATWHAVVRTLQTSWAVYASAGQSRGWVTVRIGDTDCRLPATGLWVLTGAEDWLRALSLAMICREHATVTALCDISPASLFSGERTDVFAYFWVAAWKAYWQGSGHVADWVRAAVDGTDPSRLRRVTAEHVEMYRREMEMVRHLAEPDSRKFNEALVAALESHSRYWTNDDPEALRPNDPEGFVAWRVLGPACLAMDRGLTLGVESEYLPKNLLHGSWVGERSVCPPATVSTHEDKQLGSRRKSARRKFLRRG